MTSPLPEVTFDSISSSVVAAPCVRNNAANTFELDIVVSCGRVQRRLRISEQARIVALVGPSGIGKTSVLNAIAGLTTPVKGRIEIEQRVIYDSEKKIEVAPWRRAVGYVFQDTRLFPHMNVRRNLVYGRHSRSGNLRFLFDTVVELLQIESLLDRRPAHLSGGEAQRVAIGRALLAQPAILLFDEPLSAVDQARRETLIPFLQRIRDEIKLPMLYVSHQLEEVHRLTSAVYGLSDAHGSHE